MVNAQIIREAVSSMEDQITRQGIDLKSLVEVIKELQDLPCNAEATVFKEIVDSAMVIRIINRNS